MILFGNETSSKFVNGVLGSVVEKHLPNEAHHIKKEEVAEEENEATETEAVQTLAE